MNPLILMACSAHINDFCYVSGGGNFMSNGIYRKSTGLGPLNMRIIVRYTLGGPFDAYAIFGSYDTRIDANVIYYWPYSEGFNPTHVYVGQNGVSPAPSVRA